VAATSTFNEVRHRIERDTSSPADVDDLEFAAGDQLVRECPPDPKLAGGLRDGEQNRLGSKD
jgi:hypothetical protein